MVFTIYFKDKNSYIDNYYIINHSYLYKNNIFYEILLDYFDSYNILYYLY